MASTKLTNWIKEQIVRDLLAHRFTKACDALIAERAAFALRVYNDVYSTAMRKRMADLPSGWLPECSHIAVQFGGGSGYESLPLNGSDHGKIAKFSTKPIETVDRRFLSRHARNCVKVYDLDHQLSIANTALGTRRDELNTQVEQAERQANSALNSVSTIGRLVEIWPEIEPFARRHENAKAALPALPTAELNRLLDLPIAA